MKYSKVIVFILISYHGMAQDARLTSGLAVGADCPAFDPRHVTGPDKGTKACPMCKYGSGQGVMIWMNTDDWNNISTLTSALEKEIDKQGLKKFRVFLVYMNPELKSKEDIEKLLSEFSRENNLKKLAVTYIPAPDDEETAGSYEINPDAKVKNTIFVYKKRGVVEKVINFVATDTSIKQLLSRI
jgi:protocatechuate 3,4-dioxygenase, beta subunit